MVKIKIKFEILFLVILLTIISGCGKLGGQGSSKSSGTGTDGITINFLENNPQDRFIVGDEEEPISIILELRNKGSYPKDNDINELNRGQVYISGFDTDIISMETASKRLNRDFLPGISDINPEGSFDTAEFKGSIFADNIVVDKYEPTILATICYPYITKASPNVCIDPFPFDEKQKKVCNIGSQTLSSQGAPIAVTKIEQEASSNKIRFKISLKNVGGGDIIKINALEKCNPSQTERLERNDFDRVELRRATVGFTELRCAPFDEGNQIRFVNGEGSIICTIDSDSYDDVNSAYTTLLNMEIRYGYRTTISKSIKISKITSVS